jgi:N-ethylmaleimide reductase
MAPMTRNRAVDANSPNALMAEYYGGLFNDAQVGAWKRVTDAVHAKGGKIKATVDSVL